MAYFKSLSKNQSNRQMFNKDPIVYANPHPTEQDYGYMSKNPANKTNASLRVRSPNALPSISPTEDPSSSVIDARGSSNTSGVYT